MYWLYCVLGLLIYSHYIQGKKPYGKLQQEIWRLDCDMGKITDSDCPVDGGWSSWTPWSSCQGACDDVGHRRRMRKCNNPQTTNGGTPCVGQAQQVEACYITNCTVEDFYKLVSGDATRTEALLQLKAVPALLEQCLQMECPYEAIEAALLSDNTWQLKAEAVWNSLQCVKHNIGCPVKGEWGVWGSWSECGSRCGKGLRWRIRRCDTPPPSDATLICSGTPMQSDECEGDQCAIEGRYDKYTTRGTWSEWGQWTVCSESCGSGVRRRKRTCLESPNAFGSFIWGTHCRGQHDQLVICFNTRCSLDGGWSGWGPWGPCSRTCDAGRRSRTRSCTKPIPSGGGKFCDGPKIETGSCYLEPCVVYTHLVAILKEDSYLQYNLPGKRSSLFHFYIRFRPLSPSGTLVRRGSLQSPYVRLSLQKWHICLDASGMSQSCGLPRICSSTALEPEVWHTALIAISSDSAIMRLDNALTSITDFFPCDPELENSAINIYIGERFNGEIQELILNFSPLTILIERDDRPQRRSDHQPSLSSNVVYEKANTGEAFLFMENDHYIRFPCFNEVNEWRLELTLKPAHDNGIILFLPDHTKQSWFYMVLQNRRLKIKLTIGEFRSEKTSCIDYPPQQWLHITLSKIGGSNTIESTINSGEKLHIIHVESIDKMHRKATNNNLKKEKNNTKIEAMSICHDEFFIGDIPGIVKNQILEEFPAFSGVLASLIINGELIDLHNCSLERYKNTKIQLSSRTASISRSYHETGWGTSNSLNLTCLHAKIAQTNNYAHWLLLDTSVTEVLSDKNIKLIEDGRMLRLLVTVEDNLIGFYTCRLHSYKYTYNVVTYGILGQVKYNLNNPDLTTIIAVFTTVTLVVCTLSWLVLEGLNDLRHGYGFFRDAHFTPQEDAEALCKYIDQNAHLFSSKSAIRLAKTEVRRKARRLTSRISFGAQEPEGLLEMQNEIPEASNSQTKEFVTLAALPEINSSRTGTSHDIYRCETFQCSPKHDPLVFTGRKVSTSSTLDMSPRVLCSRLRLTKQKHSSKDNIVNRLTKDKSKCSETLSYDNKRKSFKLKPITIDVSPAQKVLQRFNVLKNYDS